MEIKELMRKCLSKTIKYDIIQPLSLQAYKFEPAAFKKKEIEFSVTYNQW